MEVGILSRSLLLIIFLTGCATVLPPDMVVTVTTYNDVQALASVCDNDGTSCVFTDQATVCDMHLAAAANGDYLMGDYWHEEQHCVGQNPDVPITRM